MPQMRKRVDILESIALRDVSSELVLRDVSSELLLVLSIYGTRLDPMDG